MHVKKKKKRKKKKRKGKNENSFLFSTWGFLRRKKKLT